MPQPPATGHADAARAAPPSENERSRHLVPKLAAWFAGCLALLYLGTGIWTHAFPPVRSPLTVHVTFPSGIAGQGEPLITTGVPKNCDFLAVRYLDEQTAELVYDVWAVGGPESAPFALEPGVRRTLEIQMPALDHIPHFISHEKRPLRVVLDGREVIDTSVHFNRRRPNAIHFASNPFGGTIAGETFRGKVTTPEGRELRGGPESLFTRRERIAWILSNRFWPSAGAVLVCAALGFVTYHLALFGGALHRRFHWRMASTTFEGHPIAPHRWFIATAILCTLAFTWVITGGTFRILFAESFGDYYDYQAASLLDGRLDVPEHALSGEAFIFEGKVYGYFGPTPALLRLPFAATKLLIGKLSRSYMLAYYVACLVAIYAILIHVARQLSRRASWPSRFEVVLFVGSAGLGSTLFFLSSRAYIYHEAILCGAAFALWGGYFSLRYLTEPERRWWLAAIACGVLAVHARPPLGLFALSMIGAAAVVTMCRSLRAGDWKSGRRGGTDPIAGSRPALPGNRLKASSCTRPLAIAVLAGLGVLSFNGLSYLKFKSFEGAPLRYHVQYDAARLAAIASRNFHLGNVRHNFDGYLARCGIVSRPVFPYVYIGGYDPHKYPTARIDLAEPTLALPCSMPALFLMALGGGAFAFLVWPEARVPLGVIAVATLPMAGALMLAIAISHRYTADFCPALLLAAAFGLTSLQALPRRYRCAAHATAAGLAVISMVITTAITLGYQGEQVWGVPDDVKQHFQILRNTVDGIFGFNR